MLKISLETVTYNTGLSKTTVAKFEAGGELRPAVLETLRNFLESAGIVFTDGGTGVRLRRVSDC